MKKISAYSPCFNAAATLERSLASIRAQTYPVFECLTAADGGDPAAWELAERQSVRVLRDHGDENRGLAASCNTALRHATGEFLAKVDSDVELSDFFLERAMIHFRDERVAGVGGRLIETYQDTIANRWRQRWMPQHWSHQMSPQTNPPFLFGADCVFRCEALRKIGGWQSKYRTNYEDVDVSHRLVAAGYHLVYEPMAICRHLRRDTLPEVLDGWHRWYRDAADNVGGYSSLEAAAQLVGQHAQRASHQIEAVKAEGSFDLIYLSVLNFFWQCLCDLKYLAVRGVAPEELLAATSAELYGCIKAQAADSSQSTTPACVWDRLLQDVRPMPGDCAGWEPDATYLAAFRQCLAGLECGPFSAWAVETSVMAMEG